MAMIDRSREKDRPLLVNDLLRREFDRTRTKLPPELFSLKSTNSFSVVGDQIDVQRTVRQLDVGDRMTAFQIDSAIRCVAGLLGKDGARLPVEEVAGAGGPGHVPPYRPDWIEYSVTPKACTSPELEKLIRVNGGKIFPHGYVFGNDDRQTFYPSGYPWQCIGKLLVWSDPSTDYPQMTGTATLVGPNLILTAGHMAPWGADPWMVQFVPAYFNGSSILGSGVYSYVESYRGNSGSDSKAWDHALMKLYDPIGSWIGWLGTRTYDDDWEDMNVWTLVGYPGAIANAEQPSWQGGISFHDDDEDGDGMELETDNGDSSPGDSGGPFFANWDDGPHIVGVDSGGEEEYQFPFSTQDNNIAAGGKALVDLVKWGYANWPA